MENKGKRKAIIKEEEKEDLEVNELVLGIMDGYSDSTIPPLSLFKPSLSDSIVNVISIEDSTSRKRGIIDNMKERERRVKMNDNYSLLESIVPGLLPKSTKEKVIHGTIEYIKYLEEKKKMLEKLKENESLGPKRKLVLPFATKNSSVSVTVCGRVGFFGIQTPKRQGLVAQIFMVFQNHRAEVLAANIVANESQLTLTVTALVNGHDSNSSGISTIEEIKREILML